jgi:hypothetical protein
VHRVLRCYCHTLAVVVAKARSWLLTTSSRYCREASMDACGPYTRDCLCLIAVMQWYVRCHRCSARSMIIDTLFRVYSVLANVHQMWLDFDHTCESSCELLGLTDLRNCRHTWLQYLSSCVDSFNSVVARLFWHALNKCAYKHLYPVHNATTSR